MTNRTRNEWHRGEKGAIIISTRCPACKRAVVIFNPAGITGLTTLVHSGLPRSAVVTQAALDSTRLQSALAQQLSVAQD